MWVLAPQPETEPTPSIPEGDILTSSLSGKSLPHPFLKQPPSEQWGQESGQCWDGCPGCPARQNSRCGDPRVWAGATAVVQPASSCWEGSQSWGAVLSIDTGLAWAAGRKEVLPCLELVELASLIHCPSGAHHPQVHERGLSWALGPVQSCLLLTAPDLGRRLPLLSSAYSSGE